jgi:hypothetical protein
MIIGSGNSVQTGQNSGCQGPYGIPGNPKNFELVVLEHGGPNGTQLVHYWRDNSLRNHPWNPSPGRPHVVISEKATSEGSIIFSSYGRLEVLGNEGGVVSHYVRIGGEWKLQAYVNQAGHPAATGPPGLI